VVGAAPAHPYTLGLLRSFPDLRGERRELRGVPGTPSDLRNDFRGCPFADRCEYAFASCRTAVPALLPLPGRAPAGALSRDGSWLAACHLHDPARRPGGPPDTLKAPPAHSDHDIAPAESAER
jgi:peptide/nickel transport system ATP-binding protein